MLRIFTSRRCQLHDPPGFVESPHRLEAVLGALKDSAWETVEVDDHRAADETVRALHDSAYVDRFERAVERGDGLLDSADNPLAAGSWKAAWAAAETALAAADWAAGGAGRKAFAAVRPPGHHAERGTAMGFCFFGNVALAAERLRRHHGAERVAIFDFDVHHGNGTQHLVEERADILFVSTHQFPFYPGTGSAGETGLGDGDGFTVNVPLPAGTGDEGYREAIEQRVLPALRDYRPEVLLLSAGFDAWRDDPLGGMRVTEEGFREWGRLLGELAEEVCDGRVVVLLEGGYDLAALGRLARLHLAALDGGAD